MSRATRNSGSLTSGRRVRERDALPALRLWDLCKTFGGQKALDRASLMSLRAKCTVCSARTVRASRP